MPDITMCRDQECPARHGCKRFTSIPDEYQAYFTESPRQETNCEMYWGQSSDAIFNQLKNIVNGTESEDTKTES